VATIPYGDGMLALNRWRAVYAEPFADAYAEAFLRLALVAGKVAR